VEDVSTPSESVLIAQVRSDVGGGPLRSPHPTWMDAPESQRPAVALPADPSQRRPCRLCGYHAPQAASCPHCGLEPVERSLTLPAPGLAGEAWAGATALLRGFGFLARDPRAMVWVAIPMALTVSIFLGATVWLVGLFESAAASVPGEVHFDERVPAWLARLLAWPVEHGVAGVAADVAAVTLALATAALTFWFAFSIVFEAIAGPFLDELHGRFETAWFGADPRDGLERPSGVTPRSAARTSVAALALGSAGGALATLLGAGPLVALACALGPVIAVAAARPSWARWLAWVARTELQALRASMAALALTGTVLLASLPLLVVPVLGTYLYGAAAGFATSLGLLDIPFSRRGLDLAARRRFLARHALATTLYGASAGLLFGVPFLGPLLAVPAASVGGLWLFCRLDKSELRVRPDGPGPGPESP
jgi:uncharacterized protein involved in cysteine biosynthesis